MNSQLADQKRMRPLSIWDLPASLMKPPHRFRKRAPQRGRERRHQAAILAFIYRNRFATTSQVQRRFADKMKSDRTARRHLAEMQECLGYLDLVPTPSPLWPKVYSVSGRGMRKLAHTFQKKQPSWTAPVNDRKRIGFSIHHVYHELACTEFLLQVHESAKAIGAELLDMQRRSLVRNDVFRLPAESGSRLVPDGMFLLRTGDGMICSFLELDTGSMSLTALADKLHRYSLWSTTEHGQSFVSDQYRKHGALNPQARFRIALICSDSHQADGTKRLQALIGVAKQLPQSFRKTLWLTTAMAVRDSENPLAIRIWSHPVNKDSSPTIRESFLRQRHTLPNLAHSGLLDAP